MLYSCCSPSELNASALTAMLVAADSLARGTPKDMLVQSPTPSIVLPAQLLYKVVSTWAVGPDEQSPDVLEPTTSVSGFLNEQQPSTVNTGTVYVLEA